MILLASLRSDKWTACPEHVDEFIGLRSPFGIRQPIVLRVARIRHRAEL